MQGSVSRGYFMSNDDAMRAQGQLVNDYRDAKTNLVRLHGEASNIGRNLVELGRALEENQEHPVRMDEGEMKKLLDATRISALMQEITEVYHRKLNLEGRLREIGLEFK